MADKIKTVCELVREIHLAAMGQLRPKDVVKHLINDSELIVKLVSHEDFWLKSFAQDVDPRWTQLDYIGHAIVWALRNADSNEMLGELSNESVKALKDILSIVKDYERPNKRDADVVGDTYYRNVSRHNMAPVKKIEYNVVRFSAFFTSAVAANWDAVVNEMNKWIDTLGVRQNVKSTNKQDTEQIKEQATEEIPETAEIIPETEEVIQQTAEIIPETNIVVEQVAAQQAEPVQEIKTAPEAVASALANKEKLDTPKIDNEELWTTERLAHELGYKDAMSFHSAKYYVLKKNPDAAAKLDKWFSGVVAGKKRSLFKAKYFEELKQLFGGRDKPRIESESKQKTKVADATEADGELWSLVQLADKLGMPNVNVLYAKKNACIARNQNLAEQMKDWFVKRGNYRYFKAKYFEELKALFASSRNLQPTIRIKNVDDIAGELWSLAKLAEKLGLRDTQMFSKKKTIFLQKHQNMIEQVTGWFVKQGKNSFFIAEHFDELKALFDGPKNIPAQGAKVVAPIKEQVVIDDAPVVDTESREAEQNMKNISGTKIQEQIADSKDNNNDANHDVIIEQEIDLTGANGIKVYSAYLDKLHALYRAEYEKKEQNEKQHKELMTQAQVLQDSISESTKKLDSIAETISETKELLKKKKAAEESKQEAENILQEVDARMIQLLQTQNEIVK